MSLLRKPDEEGEIKPLISSGLPPHLEALKKSFHSDLDHKSQLLEKIMLNIHNTVNRMHGHPDTMWQQIDFQAEAIDQIIQELCNKIQQALEEKHPPESPSETEGILFLIRQLEWDLGQQYCVEDYVEKLLGELQTKGPEAIYPETLLGLASQKTVQDYNIAGYPGRPLPTNSWWLPLSDPLGSGSLKLQVVDDTETITDPLHSIRLRDAQRFKAAAHIHEEITIPFLKGSFPSVDQGCYLLNQSGLGLELTQTEQLWANPEDRPAIHSLIVGIKEPTNRPPMVLSYDDHCATLHYMAGEASLTAPVLRGSPFITLLYRNSTPVLHVAKMKIRPESIRAYSCFLVVPDSQFTDPDSQIPLSKTKVQSETLFMLNPHELKGQLFSFEIDETGETYLIFCSTPLTFKSVHLIEQVLLPENVTIPSEETVQYAICKEGQIPYSTQLAYSNVPLINGLESTTPCSEVTIRVIKVPRGISVEKATFELLNYAWVYATGGSFLVTENGGWKYSYTTRLIDPIAHFRKHRSLQSSQQDLLVSLLPHDYDRLAPSTPVVDLSYQTLHGPARLVAATDAELHFSQNQQPVEWPEAKLSSLTHEEIHVLVELTIASSERFDLKARGTSPLETARQISDMASLSHALFSLLARDPLLIDNAPFMRAFQSALTIAQAALDDFLVGGLLQYDATERRVIVSSSESNPERLYGYLIHAAAAIRGISPEWFTRNRAKVIELLIADVCSPYDQSPNFPKMRMLDPYLSLPSEELGQRQSIGEAINSLSGIALWANSSGDEELYLFAQTLLGRLRDAARMYCLPQNPSSIYSKSDPSSSTQPFAEHLLCFTGTANRPAVENPLERLAEQSQGNSTWVESVTAAIAFEEFFGCDLNHFDEAAFLEHFHQAPLLQVVKYPSLIPLIAQVSPHCADAILEWAIRANHRNGNAYPWRSEALYLLMKMEIITSAKKTKDPLSLPIPHSSWPQLPQTVEENPLQFWLDRGESWLSSSTANSVAFKMAEHLCKEIRTLIDCQGTVQDLHLWAHSIVLPAIRESYPHVSYDELYPFCVITQTDPQDVVHEQLAEAHAPFTPETIDIQTPFSEEPIAHPIFGGVKAEITAYLSEKTNDLHRAQSFLKIPQELPATDDDWRKLLSFAQSKQQQLQNDISSCKAPAHWTAVAAKYGFQGGIREIQQEAVQILQLFSRLPNVRKALNCFSDALDKIDFLAASQGSFEELAQWANTVDTSGLTHPDLAVWALLTG